MLVGGNACTGERQREICSGVIWIGNWENDAAGLRAAGWGRKGHVNGTTALRRH